MGRPFARIVVALGVAVSIPSCSLVSSFDGYGGKTLTDEGGAPTPVDSGPSTGDGSVADSGVDAGPCGQPDPTLLAYYKLDDGSGNKAKDCSGKGNDGTIGGTTTWVAGKSGGALKFNGSSTCIDVGAGKATNLSAFTVAAWVNVVDYADTFNVARYIVGVTTDADARGWRFGSETGGAFGVKIGQAGGPLSVISPTGQPTNMWIHVGAVYEKGVRTEVFVNGASVATNPSAPAIIEEAGAHLRVGCVQAGLGLNYHFSGTMDEFRLYSRALAASEMAALAQ